MSSSEPRPEQKPPFIRWSDVLGPLVRPLAFVHKFNNSKLRCLSDPRDVVDVHFNARLRAFTARRLFEVVARLSLGVLVLVLIEAGWYWFEYERRVNDPRALGSLYLQLFGVFILGLVLLCLWEMRRWYLHVQSLIPDCIVDTGTTLCVKCQFDLRGTTQAICTECGAEIPPRQKISINDAQTDHATAISGVAGDGNGPVMRTLPEYSAILGLWTVPIAAVARMLERRFWVVGDSKAVVDVLIAAMGHSASMARMGRFVLVCGLGLASVFAVVVVQSVRHIGGAGQPMPGAVYVPFIGLMAFVAFASFAVVYLIDWFRAVQEQVPVYCRDAGVIVCFKCGYDLRAAVTCTCTECGTELDAPLLAKLGLKSVASDETGLPELI